MNAIAEVWVWVCNFDAETLGMAPCIRCGSLADDLLCPGCEEAQRDRELLRARHDAGSPDAAWPEVRRMLRDPGLVAFADPAVLYGDGYTVDEDPMAGWTWDAEEE